MQFVPGNNEKEIWSKFNVVSVDENVVVRPVPSFMDPREEYVQEMVSGREIMIVSTVMKYFVWHPKDLLFYTY